MGKSCEKKLLFSTENIAGKYAYSYNKDPLVKIPLKPYRCERHRGWHVATEKQHADNWYSRLQSLLDKISLNQIR